MHIPRLHKQLILVVGGFLILVGLSGLGENTHQAELDTALVVTAPPQQQILVETDQTSEASELRVELVDEVKAGDSLASIFLRNGFSSRDVHEITRTEHGKQLAEIFPGHRLAFTKLSNTLETLTYSTDRLTSYTFHRDGDQFTAIKQVFQPGPSNHL